VPAVEIERFRQEARAWLCANAGHAPPDYGAILPPDLRDQGTAWQRRLHDAGFAGIHWPEEHGGRGLTPEHTAVWLEEAAFAGVPPFINMVGVVLAGGTILAAGTEEQRAEHLAPILRGERVWCQLFSEPEAGSDLASLTTRAEPDGDGGWRVSGQKVWCSNGRVSDWGILLARTDPDAPKHRGISFFLLDMGLPGIEVRPLRQMTGASEFDEVFLDGVHVAPDCLVGPLHGGWGVAMGTLTNERGHIGAAVVSLGRRLDELAAAGRKGAADDAVRRDGLMRLLAAGRAYQRLGRRQGPVASTAASLLKLGITELLFDVAVHRTSAVGPPAMLADDEAAGLVGAPGARIAGGTSQIQRTIIGELLLGLPKEPRPSR
jgi:alkylation response protein AidB-like acyl-CoA dehydrogenase